MAASTRDWRRLDAGRRGLALGVLVLLIAGLQIPRVAAQATPGTDGVFYSRQPAFRIPFSTDPGDRRIRQVLLHASEDMGRSYHSVATAAPTAKFFEYQARAEGWYWFTVQTEDQDGRRYPPDLSAVQPQLKVCVDARPPTVTVRAGRSSDQPLAIEWDVRDDNSGLDLQTLRAAYRPVGAGSAQWLDLPIQQLAFGTKDWTPAGTATQYEVRVQVRDRAQNIGESLVTLTAAGAGRTMATTVTPNPNAGLPTGERVIFVNKKQIKFNFKIDDVGPSKVKAVEVWWTQERGKWQKYPQDAGPDPPYTVEVAAEGRYGFTLIAVSGVGHKEGELTANSSPQVWVEVDLTAPKVRFLGAEVGTGLDKGLLTVHWSATDKFIAAQPVTLSYGTADGQWVPFATNIANDGKYVWRMPDGLPYKFPIKIDAVDQAGNVGSDKSVTDIIVDLSIPKARVINVEGVQAGP